MNIVFAGTPEFAKVQLEALIGNNYPIALVLTQPDRPAGRGQKLTPSPVKVLAQAHNIEVAQPTSLKQGEIIQQLEDIKPDLMIVSAYGMLLPQNILDLPKHGCWNIHASLLPRWRGAAPIHYAIWKGDDKTGISLMQMEAGLDSGPVLLRSAIPIEDTDTTGSLYNKLSQLGAQLLLEGLSKIDKLKPQPQDERAVTFSPKIQKEQAQINWGEPAIDIARAIRAFNPAPGAFTFYEQERIKLLSASPQSEHQSNHPPGQIIHLGPEGMSIATQNGVLVVHTLQRPGKKPQAISDVLNSHPNLFAVGNLFS